MFAVPMRYSLLQVGKVAPHDINFLTIAALDKPLSELQKTSPADLQGIYRDGLKTLGLWSFRSYPLEER